MTPRRASVAAPSEPVSITIIVPGCPDRILAPNRRAHGKAKAGGVAQHRGDAKYAALDALVTRINTLGGSDVPLFTGPVAVEAHVCWAKGERVHDLDAVGIMVKPFLDGLTDAGVWTDDALMQRYTVSQEPYRTSKTTGQVILTITSIQEGTRAA